MGEEGGGRGWSRNRREILTVALRGRKNGLTERQGGWKGGIKSRSLQGEGPGEQTGGSPWEPWICRWEIGLAGRRVEF